MVAVPTREPGAYEGSRLREAFGRFFDDRGVRVVAAVADSYDDLVRAWFKQVDGSPGRLVSVQFVEKGGHCCASAWTPISGRRQEQTPWSVGRHPVRPRGAAPAAPPSAGRVRRRR